jgi:hypothetical protein
MLDGAGSAISTIRRCAREGAGEGRRPPQMHATVASWLNNHAGKTKTPAPRQKPQHFCWGFWGW